MKNQRIIVILSLIVLFVLGNIVVAVAALSLPGKPSDYCWIDNGTGGRYYFYNCDSTNCEEAGPSEKSCAKLIN